MLSMQRRLLGQVKSTLQIGNDYSVEPAGLSWRSNTFFIVSTVAVGLFTDLFLYGLVVPILPYMLQDRVSLPDDQVQSNVDGLLAAYAGASVLFSPVAGYIADKTSTRQAPFLLGLLALMLATLLLFLGTNIPVLVVARLLQGISGGFVWTIGLALCLETVGPENPGKTIGSVSSRRENKPEARLHLTKHRYFLLYRLAIYSRHSSVAFCMRKPVMPVSSVSAWLYWPLTLLCGFR